MQAFLDLIRFTNGFNIWGVAIRMLLAVICGGLIGIEREYKRRPAGFRTHILICLGASMTTLTSQYIYLSLDMFTDLTRLGHHDQFHDDQGYRIYQLNQLRIEGSYSVT